MSHNTANAPDFSGRLPCPGHEVELGGVGGIQLALASGAGSGLWAPTRGSAGGRGWCLSPCPRPVPSLLDCSTQGSGPSLPCSSTPRPPLPLIVLPDSPRPLRPASSLCLQPPPVQGSLRGPPVLPWLLRSCPHSLSPTAVPAFLGPAIPAPHRSPGRLCWSRLGAGPSGLWKEGGPRGQEDPGDWPPRRGVGSPVGPATGRAVQLAGSPV